MLLLRLLVGVVELMDKAQSDPEIPRVRRIHMRACASASATSTHRAANCSNARDAQKPQSTQQQPGS